MFFFLSPAIQIGTIREKQITILEPKESGRQISFDSRFSLNVKVYLVTENIDDLANLRIVTTFPDNRMAFFRVTENDIVKRHEKLNQSYLSTVIPISAEKWDGAGNVQICVYELGKCHILSKEMYFENNFAFDKSQMLAPSVSNDLVEISQPVTIIIRPSI